MSENPQSPQGDKARRPRPFGGFLLFLTVLVVVLFAFGSNHWIPAKFEIGFPVPADRDEGAIGGYHCWVQFYLPERGWVPIDASEAAKHPEQRELLYGSHPADRIHFTTGRDLRLSAGSESQPLNYFVYPYAEVNGKPYEGRIATRFSFREITDS